MDDAPGPGRDPGRDGACGGCGWSGPMALARDAGPGDAAADPLILACPRCGSPLLPELPSVAEILAARRAPEA